MSPQRIIFVSAAMILTWGICSVGHSQECQVCNSQNRHTILVHGEIFTKPERVNDRLWPIVLKNSVSEIREKSLALRPDKISWIRRGIKTG
jgi:hypothetical protein